MGSQPCVLVVLKVVFLLEAQPLPVQPPLTQRQLVDRGREHGTETVGVLIEVNHCDLKFVLLRAGHLGAEEPGFPTDENASVPVAVLTEEAVETALISLGSCSAVIRTRISAAFWETVNERHCEA